jgi:outer membrane cobalamin receptor
MDFADVAFIPSLAAIYKFNEKNIVKLLYGKAIMRPSFFAHLNNIFSDVPVLKPEWITSYELNYTGAISSMLSLNVSLFHNDIEDLIDRVYTVLEDGTFATYMSNSGKLSSNGVELGLRIRPTEKLDVDVSMTYQDVVDKNHENVELAYSPKLLWYFKAAYKPFRNLTFAVTGNYVDAMESQYDFQPSDPNDINSAPIGRIGDKADGYLNLGANLRVDHLFKTPLYLNLRVSNLFDKEFFYPITGSTSYWLDKGTLGIGRTILFTLGLDMK